MGCGNVIARTASQLPDAVKRTVVALCADFERRRELIEGRLLSRRTELEFRYLNYKIAEAAIEVVGEANAKIYIEEIGGRIGYAKSKLLCISESTYKRKKSEIILNIAKKLHLSD